MGDERTPRAKRHSEQRKRDAPLRYELEMESRKVGWGDPALVYEEEKDFFRFRDGRFAFSREHADWDLLRKRGPMKGSSALRKPLSPQDAAPRYQRHTFVFLMYPESSNTSKASTTAAHRSVLMLLLSTSTHSGDKGAGAKPRRIRSFPLLVPLGGELAPIIEESECP